MIRKPAVLYFHQGGIGDCIHDLYVINRIIKSRFSDRIIYVHKPHFEDFILSLKLSSSGVESIVLRSLSNFVRLIYYFITTDYQIAGVGTNIYKFGMISRLFFCKNSIGGLTHSPEYFGGPLIRLFRPDNVIELHRRHRVEVGNAILDDISVPEFESKPIVEFNNESMLYSKLKKILLLPDVRDDKIVLIQVGSASVRGLKDVSSDFIVSLILGVNKKDVFFILSGMGDDDYCKAERIIYKLQEYGVKVQNLVNSLSLIDVTILIKYDVDICISSDSSLGHIAALFDKPTISLFGPTDPNVVAPYSNKSYVVKCSLSCSPCYLSHEYYECADNKCIKDISPFSVSKLLLALICDQRVEFSGNTIKRMSFLHEKGSDTSI